MIWFRCLFKKKSVQVVVARPVDKSFATSAMTAIAKDFLHLLAENQTTDDRVVNVMLVLETPSGEDVLTIVPTWYATCNDKVMLEDGAALYLSESMLGREAFECFCASPVSEVFEKLSKKNPPICVEPHETYYMLHSVTDAEVLSAVISRFVAEVFGLKLEDLSIRGVTQILDNGKDIDGGDILYDPATGLRKE